MKPLLLNALAIIPLLLNFSASILHAELGNVSMYLPSSARAGGMGDAFTALADDASAIEFNPAGLTGNGKYFASFMHMNLGPEVYYEYLNGSLQIPWGSIGISFSYIHLAKEETLTSTEGFTYYDLLISAAYAKKILPGLSIGLTTRFINSGIAEYHASAFLFDVGLLYGLKFLDLGHLNDRNLFFGVVWKNFGTGLKYAEKTEYVPMAGRFGMAYKLGYPLTFLSDIEKREGHPLRFGIGIESITGKFVNLRLGYHGGDGLSAFTGGLGIMVKTGKFLTTADMAMSFEQDLTKKLYLTITFQEANIKARKYALKPIPGLEEESHPIPYKVKEAIFSNTNNTSDTNKVKGVSYIPRMGTDTEYLDKEKELYGWDALTFENFEESDLVAKITGETPIQILSEGSNRYGHWIMPSNISSNELHTIVRLPNLKLYEGLRLRLKTSAIRSLTIELIESRDTGPRTWKVEILDLPAGEWETRKIPFRYFSLQDEPTTIIDLTRISQIKFIIKNEGDSPHVFQFDDVVFYR